jgi:hypothetical protein
MLDDAAEQPVAVNRMLAHLFPFVRIEGARLVDDVGLHVNLADIVELGCGGQSLLVAGVQSEPFAECRRDSGDAFTMWHEPRGVSSD